MQCDIDEQVTRMAEKYFPELCDSNNDPRAKLMFDDGIAYMANCPAGQHRRRDRRLDRSGRPGRGPVQQGLLRVCFRALKDDGILVQQSESPLVLLELIKEMRDDMGKAGFTTFRTLPFPQPCYPTGWWSCTLARKGGRLRLPRGRRARARRSRRSTTPPTSTRARWRRFPSWPKRWANNARSPSRRGV